MSAGADEASCSGSLPNQSLMRTPGAVAVEELGLATRRRIARRSANDFAPLNHNQRV